MSTVRFDSASSTQSDKTTTERFRVKPARKVPAPPASSIKAEGSVRLVCISDTHLRTDNLVVPPGDILIHAGDFTSTGKQTEVEHFVAFMKSQPHQHKIVIAGNHEIPFDEDKCNDGSGFGRRFHRFQMFDGNELKDIVRSCCTYLQDEAVTVCGLRIYGSPWQPEFFNWAFNLPRGPAILEKWRKIPSDVDVLITHGPPLGHGDVCDDGLNVGCADLLSEIQNRIRPTVHVFGHVHEGYGITTDEHTKYINASTCNRSYSPSNPPIVWDAVPRVQGLADDLIAKPK
eukprot:Opistho-2@53120